MKLIGLFILLLSTSVYAQGPLLNQTLALTDKQKCTLTIAPTNGANTVPVTNITWSSTNSNCAAALADPNKPLTAILFTIGGASCTTTITVSAQDSSGNRGEQSIDVTVTHVLDTSLFLNLIASDVRLKTAP